MPPNVLVSKDFFQVKACDFGLSRIKESATVTQINVVPGTFLYMAPESLLGGVRSNFSTDVWSLGATLVELFVGEDIWKIEKKKNVHDEISQHMENQELPTAALALRQNNEQLFAVVEGCFSYSSESRDTVWQLQRKLRAYVEKA